MRSLLLSHPQSLVDSLGRWESSHCHKEACSRLLQKPHQESGIFFSPPGTNHRLGYMDLQQLQIPHPNPTPGTTQILTHLLFPGPLAPVKDTHRQHEHGSWGTRQAVGPRKTWAPRGTLRAGRKENWSERQRDRVEQQCENEGSENRLGKHRATQDSIAWSVLERSNMTGGCGDGE